MTQPVGGRQAHVGFRRRRTSRHRRSRVIRRVLLISALVLLVMACSAVTLQYLSPSLFRAQGKPILIQQNPLRRERSLLTAAQILNAMPPSRPVYPYSVVPGGVEDIKELKWVAEHDPVVATHYSGFDYDHARVVRLVLERTAYISYRIGNHVYWTRRRISLHKGEKLITDGKKTIRARCGNRVEELPQQATNSAEPTPEKFEQPINPGEGTATKTPPVPFQSALLTRPAVSGSELRVPLSLYDPIEGGFWIPISMPPVPVGVCSPGKKKGNETSGDTGNGKHKKGGPCGPGHTTVPEPGTWLLVASGLGFIVWQSKRRVQRSSC